MYLCIFHLHIWYIYVSASPLSSSRARRELDSHIVITENWEEFYTKLDHKNVRAFCSHSNSIYCLPHLQLILAPYCGDCEDIIKKKTTRCVRNSNFTDLCVCVCVCVCVCMCMKLFIYCPPLLPEMSHQSLEPQPWEPRLCASFKQPKAITPGMLCVRPDCNKPAKYYTLFGRSY